jgi:hypothetical protein
MGQRLDYDIDKVTIQKNVYHPQGHVEVELEQHALRKAALAFLSGERPVQTTVVGRVQVTGELPPPEEVAVPALPRPVLPALKAGERPPE